MLKLKNHYTKKMEFTTVNKDNIRFGYLHSLMPLNMQNEIIAMQHGHFQKTKESGTVLNSFQEISLSLIPT